MASSPMFNKFNFIQYSFSPIFNLKSVSTFAMSSCSTVVVQLNLMINNNNNISIFLQVYLVS